MGKRYEKNYIKDANKLPELFKEIQDIRYGRAAPEIPKTDNKKVEANIPYEINHKFNAIGVVIGVLFLILFSTAIHSNSIFATTEKEKKPIGKFEENDEKIDIMNVLSSNISEATTKEIVTNEVAINYETKYIESDLLPKDDQNIVQTGKFGYLDRTTILTYENEELIDEKIINEVIKSEPVEEIIEIGTSEFLANNKVHIGDVMYTTEEIEMYSSPEANDRICYIYQYIDLEILSEKDGIANISIDGLEGYVRADKLTSEAVTSGIAEKSRVKRILINVNPEMPVNCSSGLTKEDFVKVLSRNPNDKNKIFEQNAEFFYEIEQEFNVNGLFLAAMGIHESNWGTSNISVQKKNLFGYGSYDSSSYTSSYTFESYQYGIELVAKVLSKYYLNEAGTPIFDNEIATGAYYNGPTISGVNTRYASDTNWSTRVYNIMLSLYEKL